MVVSVMANLLACLVLDATIATCTWTKLDAIVQLRPQFGHLDALNDQIKSNSRSERASDANAKEDLAQDVNMVIKETADNENADMYGGMNATAKLLRLIRDEPWQHLRWIDKEVGIKQSLLICVLIRYRRAHPTQSMRMTWSITATRRHHTLFPR